MHSTFLVCLLVCFYSMQRGAWDALGRRAWERVNQCFPLSQIYSGIRSFTSVFLSQFWYWSCFRSVGFLASPSPGSRRLCSPASCAPPVHRTMAAEAAVSSKPSLASSILTLHVSRQDPPLLLHLSNPGTTAWWASLALVKSPCETTNHARFFTFCNPKGATKSYYLGNPVSVPFAVL